jgi:transcriptional regulator with XRE-family HTH domain
MIGDRIRQQRQLNDWTQHDLAFLVAHFTRGRTDARSIYRWERGDCYPRRRTIFALAGLFDVSVEWLETGAEEEAA